MQNMELQTEGVGSRLHVSRGGLVSAVLVGLTSSAMTVAVGTSSCKSPSRFGASSRPNEVTPVTLPPGRLRLAMSPSATGSPPVRMTIGIVAEARCAASAAGVEAWCCNYTHPAANQISCQNRQALVLSLGPPVFDRDVLALDKSRLVQTLTKNAEKACEQGRVSPLRNPITGIGGCCARAARGHAVAAAIPAMTSRRLIRSPHRRGREWPQARRDLALPRS